MSYCRKCPASDVYVYRGLTEGAPEALVLRRGDEADGLPTQLVCHECLLMPETTGTDREWEREHYLTPDAAAMLAHLERHQSRGHKVSDAAIARLRGEASHGRTKGTND